jgi:DNA polymerase
MIYLDLETRSQCDLIGKGLKNYSLDPTTEVICMSYAFDDGEIKTFFTEDSEFPREVAEYIEAGGLLYAHNAAFERLIFDNVFSNHAPKLEQWRCSSAHAMAHGLPGGLKDLCHALDLSVQKMKEGTRLIRDYSAPGFLTQWKAGDRELMQKYCETDVLTMRNIVKIFRDLVPAEWEQYHITERINDNGVPIDINFARAAVTYAGAVKQDVLRKLDTLSNGVIKTPTERKARNAWILPRLTEEHIELITKDEKYSFDATHRGYLLKSKNLHPDVRKYLELVEEAGSSAITKFNSMVKFEHNSRVYNVMVWSGAGATGRYSSKSLQVQNFKRDTFKDPEPIINKILNGGKIDTPAESLAKLTRAAITSEHGLTYSDYSSIEARVLPWLTGYESAEPTLNVFREGRDIYVENAVGMFYLKSEDEVTKAQRHSSKIACLACGFGGGKGAVQAMARGYGQAMSDERADEIKEAWRDANPWASRFWSDLKGASRAAFHSPNTITTAGKIQFLYNGEWLWMKLPSGRCLAYCQPRYEEVEYPWGDTGFELTVLKGSGRPKAGEKWHRHTLTNVILCNNATQGTAADIMRETIVRAYKAGLKIIFTVHDELIIEGYCKDKLHEIMLDMPEWAKGLPMNAETQEATRYGK